MGCGVWGVAYVAYPVTFTSSNNKCRRQRKFQPAGGHSKMCSMWQCGNVESAKLSRKIFSLTSDPSHTPSCHIHLLLLYRAVNGNNKNKRQGQGSVSVAKWKAIESVKEVTAHGRGEKALKKTQQKKTKIPLDLIHHLVKF